MMNFVAGLVLGIVVALYVSMAYPHQVHSAFDTVGLTSLLPNADATKAPAVAPTKS